MIRTIGLNTAATLGVAQVVPDELRRAPRVSVCCRVDVRERHGVWTAVTEDICVRGCRIVTPSFPRLGSLLTMTLSSDLFPRTLDVVAETVWATSHQLGVLFVDVAPRKGTLSPAEWLEQVLANGRVPGSASSASHVVPVVASSGPRTGSGAGFASPFARRYPLASVPAHAHASPVP